MTRRGRAQHPWGFLQRHRDGGPAAPPIALAQDLVALGRGAEAPPGAALALTGTACPLHFISCDDDRVSRLHSVLTVHREAGRWPPLVTVEDHSRNGTFLNGVPLQPGRPAVLGGGDRISLVLSVNPLAELSYVYEECTVPPPQWQTATHAAAAASPVAQAAAAATAAATAWGDGAGGNNRGSGGRRRRHAVVISPSTADALICGRAGSGGGEGGGGGSEDRAAASPPPSLPPSLLPPSPDRRRLGRQSATGFAASRLSPSTSPTSVAGSDLHGGGGSNSCYALHGDDGRETSPTATPRSRVHSHTLAQVLAGTNPSPLYSSHLEAAELDPGLSPPASPPRSPALGSLLAAATAATAVAPVSGAAARAARGRRSRSGHRRSGSAHSMGDDGSSIGADVHHVQSLSYLYQQQQLPQHSSWPAAAAAAVAVAALGPRLTAAVPPSPNLRRVRPQSSGSGSASGSGSGSGSNCWAGGNGAQQRRARAQSAGSALAAPSLSAPLPSPSSPSPLTSSPSLPSRGNTARSAAAAVAATTGQRRPLSRLLRVSTPSSPLPGSAAATPGGGAAGTVGATGAVGGFGDDDFDGASLDATPQSSRLSALARGRSISDRLGAAMAAMAAAASSAVPGHARRPGAVAAAVAAHAIAASTGAADASESDSASEIGVQEFSFSASLHPVLPPTAPPAGSTDDDEDPAAAAASTTLPIAAAAAAATAPLGATRTVRGLTIPTLNLSLLTSPYATPAVSPTAPTARRGSSSTTAASASASAAASASVAAVGSSARTSGLSRRSGLSLGSNSSSADCTTGEEHEAGDSRGGCSGGRPSGSVSGGGGTSGGGGDEAAVAAAAMWSEPSPRWLQGNQPPAVASGSARPNRPSNRQPNRRLTRYGECLDTPSPRSPAAGASRASSPFGRPAAAAAFRHAAAAAAAAAAVATGPVLGRPASETLRMTSLPGRQGNRDGSGSGRISPAATLAAEAEAAATVSRAETAGSSSTGDVVGESNRTRPYVPQTLPYTTESLGRYLDARLGSLADAAAREIRSYDGGLGCGATMSTPRSGGGSVCGSCSGVTADGGGWDRERGSSPVRGEERERYSGAASGGGSSCAHSWVSGGGGPHADGAAASTRWWGASQSDRNQEEAEPWQAAGLSPDPYEAPYPAHSPLTRPPAAAAAAAPLPVPVELAAAAAASRCAMDMYGYGSSRTTSEVLLRMQRSPSGAPHSTVTTPRGDAADADDSCERGAAHGVDVAAAALPSAQASQRPRSRLGSRLGSSGSSSGVTFIGDGGGSEYESPVLVARCPAEGAFGGGGSADGGAAVRARSLPTTEEAAAAEAHGCMTPDSPSTGRYSACSPAEQLQCGLCCEPMTAALALAPCGHSFCAHCLAEHLGRALVGGIRLRCPYRCSAFDSVVINHPARRLEHLLLEYGSGDASGGVDGSGEGDGGGQQYGCHLRHGESEDVPGTCNHYTGSSSGDAGGSGHHGLGGGAGSAAVESGSSPFQAAATAAHLALGLPAVTATAVTAAAGAAVARPARAVTPAASAAAAAAASPTIASSAAGACRGARGASDPGPPTPSTTSAAPSPSRLAATTASVRAAVRRTPPSPSPVPSQSRTGSLQSRTSPSPSADAGAGAGAGEARFVDGNVEGNDDAGGGGGGAGNGEWDELLPDEAMPLPATRLHVQQAETLVMRLREMLDRAPALEGGDAEAVLRWQRSCLGLLGSLGRLVGEHREVREALGAMGAAQGCVLVIRAAQQQEEVKQQQQAKQEQAKQEQVKQAEEEEKQGVRMETGALTQQDGEELAPVDLQRQRRQYAEVGEDCEAVRLDLTRAACVLLAALLHPPSLSPLGSPRASGPDAATCEQQSNQWALARMGGAEALAGLLGRATAAAAVTAAAESCGKGVGGGGREERPALLAAAALAALRRMVVGNIMTQAHVADCGMPAVLRVMHAMPYSEAVQVCGLQLLAELARGDDVSHVVIRQRLLEEGAVAAALAALLAPNPPVDDAHGHESHDGGRPRATTDTTTATSAGPPAAAAVAPVASGGGRSLVVGRGAVLATVVAALGVLLEAPMPRSTEALARRELRRLGGPALLQCCLRELQEEHEQPQQQGASASSSPAAAAAAGGGGVRPRRRQQRRVEDPVLDSLRDLEARARFLAGSGSGWWCSGGGAGGRGKESKREFGTGDGGGGGGVLGWPSWQVVGAAACAGFAVGATVAGSMAAAWVA